MKDEKLASAHKLLRSNLDALYERYQMLIDQGIEDQEGIYNLIIDLTEDVKDAVTLNELNVLSDQGQMVEKTLDVWMASLGISSEELSWPSFPQTRFPE